MFIEMTQFGNFRGLGNFLKDLVVVIAGCRASWF